MPDSHDGIDLMRRRMARAQRVPPTPRHPATATEATGETATPPDPVPVATPSPAASGSVVRTRPAASRRPRVGPADPPVNLAIRVRRPLDDHLVDMLHDLRKAGVRSSKVEIIEMLLWDLPADTETLRRRLGEFRRAAPRGTDGA